MQYANTLDQLMREMEFLEDEIARYQNGTEVRYKIVNDP